MTKPVRGLGVRQRVAETLDRVGVIRAILALRARAGTPWLTVLTYHRISDQGGHPFDGGVVDATPAEFDRQLALYTRYFDVVSLDDVLGFARGKSLPSNPLLVTFDDGYLDNLEVAAPVLERHGVRATFFVATQYVTDRRIFWWDRICYLLRTSTRDVVEITYPSPLRFDLANARDEAIGSALSLVKNTFGLDLDRYLLELSRATGVDWSPEKDRTLADRLLMSWDQVRKLRAAGHHVQSHTRTHRVLQTLSTAQLSDELAGSRADLERELGEPVRALAYPVGEPIARLPKVREAMRAAGYEIGFSNAGGVSPTRWKRHDPFDIRRIAVDSDMSMSHFRGVLAVPVLKSSAPLISVPESAGE